ncbi:HAD-IIIC family phosphatase [Paenibacillus chitinolyticus]|uniref:HAD-IIIC family phosphatase n=1 Tax=Paenibacillus chitinolyticus TaxID=79263 RepID=UPI00364F92CF
MIKNGKTFLELKKNCKKDKGNFPEIKITVMGDCATQFLSKAIEGYAYEYGINLNVLDVDYNQIASQVMDNHSEVYEFSPDYILIQMCAEKLYEAFCNTQPEQRYTFAQNMFVEIQNYWNMVGTHSKCRILQFNFVEMDDAIFGNYANKIDTSFIYQLRKLNMLMMDGAIQNKNVFIIDLAKIQNIFGRDVLFDEKFYYTAKMPLSMRVLPEVAKQVVDIIDALRGKLKKCIVLDLDNTLWGGVIGDDGMGAIEIGELGSGHAFSDLQMWLKELKNRGVILTVCSKNNEDTAKEPFMMHPEMVLRLEDISMFVANWDDKVSNIQYIQQTLNLGMDSFLFLDDNPFERNMVRKMIPNITVPELPEDPAQYLTYLKGLNLFETSSYSDEDKNRTSQYQAEIGRVSLQKQFVSIDDYLIDLEMVSETKPFDLFNYPRISQLTQRSNQFNLRTVRYTEAEIEAIAKDDRYLTIYFTLKDKFGDHGLVSVVILEKQDNNTLFVNTWLMSCRVLKRGMEEFIVNKIIQTARDNGFQLVIGEYLKTPKNAMVENIYGKLGFESIGNDKYKADVTTFIDNKTYIKE